MGIKEHVEKGTVTDSVVTHIVINLYAIFEVYSLSRFRNIEGVPIFQKWVT